MFYKNMPLCGQSTLLLACQKKRDPWDFKTAVHYSSECIKGHIINDIWQCFQLNSINMDDLTRKIIPSLPTSTDQIHAY